MNKKLYLEALKDILMAHDIRNEEIKDVLLDYEQMYDDALQRGLSDEEVYNLLGEPKHVYYELRDTLSQKAAKKHSNKIVALMPFIAVITFMIIGLTTDVWHPTWMVFLLIPVTAILLNTTHKEKIVALSPFVAIIIFMLIGTYTDYWTPTWLVFLIIPISSMIYEKNNVKRIIFIGSLLIAAGFYLYMGYVYDDFMIGLFGFLLPAIVILYYTELKFELLIKDPLRRKNGIIFFIILVLSLTTFLSLGLFADGWGYSWMFVLLIPIASIFLFDKSKKFTPYMPFIAVIIFYTLGYFFGLFEISWIAFLLIPIVAVIENA